MHNNHHSQLNSLFFLLIKSQSLFSLPLSPLIDNYLRNIKTLLFWAHCHSIKLSPGVLQYKNDLTSPAPSPFERVYNPSNVLPAYWTLLGRRLLAVAEHIIARRAP